jgi:hypothetical protein
MAGYRPFLYDYIMEKRQTMKEAGQAMEAGSTETFFNLAEATPAVADFVKLPRLGEIVARLLDVEAVRISHFSALFKPSGSPAIPLHQDHNFIPLNTNKTLAMWIPLTDITPEMGALFFAEGSHLHGSLNPLEARERFHIAQGATNAGDISLHTAWTLHGSLRNSSEHMREAVGIHYYADGARIQMPMEAPLIQGILDPLIQTLLNRCFGGLSVGDLAAGPLNPVVYRRQDAVAADAQSSF